MGWLIGAKGEWGEMGCLIWGEGEFGARPFKTQDAKLLISHFWERGVGESSCGVTEGTRLSV